MWLWRFRFLVKLILLPSRFGIPRNHGAQGQSRRALLRTLGNVGDGISSAVPPIFYAVARFLLPVVFFLLFLYPADAGFQDAPVYLKPPGLRFIRDISVVVPAIHSYPNQPPVKPVYRKAIGTPAAGWAVKYVGTRRFSSDQSAWIYYRISDFTDSKAAKIPQILQPLRIWPVGTTIVLESYQGDASEKNGARLMEILAMQKTKEIDGALSESFYSANWNYARFTPQGDVSLDAQKVAECHQCHSIAFHLTGDLTFTRFP